MRWIQYPKNYLSNCHGNRYEKSQIDITQSSYHSTLDVQRVYFEQSLLFFVNILILFVSLVLHWCQETNHLKSPTHTHTTNCLMKTIRKESNVVVSNRIKRLKKATSLFVRSMWEIDILIWTDIYRLFFYHSLLSYCCSSFFSVSLDEGEKEKEKRLECQSLSQVHLLTSIYLSLKLAFSLVFRWCSARRKWQMSTTIDVGFIQMQIWSQVMALVIMFR